MEEGAPFDLPVPTAGALTGVEWEDGGCDAGNPPLWSRSGMGDTGNALLAAIAITAALYHREKTGVGQAVSTSIVSAQLLAASYAWIDIDGTPAEWGHVDAGQHGLSPFYRMYECADGCWLFVAALEPESRARLRAAIGEVGDDALAPNDAEKAAAVLAVRLGKRPAHEWFARLDAAGVPVEIVDEAFCQTLFDDPDARALGLIAETTAGSVGRFEDAGLLVNLSATPTVVPRGPCMCGEHTREILLEHGYNASEVDALAEDCVVLGAPVRKRR